MTEQNNKKKKSIFVDISYTKVISNILLVLTIIGESGALFFALTHMYSPERINIFIMLPFVFFLIPYLFLSLYGHKKVKAKMEVVPRFLRDIVDNVESGMDMVTSVTNSAGNEYGVLNDDVNRFANQLAWGVNFEQSFLNFANRVGDKSLERDFLLVNEAQSVGGHVETLLRELSEKIDTANLREKERKGSLSSNTFTGYISFVIFIFILILVYNSLFLELAAQASKGGGGGMINTSQAQLSLFLTLLLMLSYEVAVLSGFLFGMMQENNLISGAPHVVVLVVMVFIGFFFFIG